jgi:transcription elongation factor
VDQSGSNFTNSVELFMSNRREFIVQLGLACAALSASQAWAQGAMIAEADAQAAALSYKADAAKGWCSAWAKKA